MFSLYKTLYKIHPRIIILESKLNLQCLFNTRFPRVRTRTLNEGGISCNNVSCTIVMREFRCLGYRIKAMCLYYIHSPKLYDLEKIDLDLKSGKEAFITKPEEKFLKRKIYKILKQEGVQTDNRKLLEHRYPQLIPAE